MEDTTKKKISLSLYDTQVLKGIALILLLCHHCWFTGEGYNELLLGDEHFPLFEKLGEFCKLCVTIFVFLSGYGLTVSTEKRGGLGNLLTFYRHRFAHLMVNYWLIYLIFVPIGILFFDRTFSSVYGEQWLKPAIADFLGLHRAVMVHSWGYNATWWFYSCIILLYLQYPLFYVLRKTWPITIALVFLLPFQLCLRFPCLWSCSNYYLAFVCGMSLAVAKPQSGGGFWVKCFLCFSLLLIIVLRFKTSVPILWDTAITLSLIYAYHEIGLPSKIKIALAFLGQHSFNIFLFHTFINGIYFYSFIRWSSNPIIIVLTLLATCIPISVFIEWIKAKCGINKIEIFLSGKNKS